MTFRSLVKLCVWYTFTHEWLIISVHSCQKIYSLDHQHPAMWLCGGSNLKQCCCLMVVGVPDPCVIWTSGARPIFTIFIRCLCFLHHFTQSISHEYLSGFVLALPGTWHHYTSNHPPAAFIIAIAHRRLFLNLISMVVKISWLLTSFHIPGICILLLIY